MESQVRTLVLMLLLLGLDHYSTTFTAAADAAKNRCDKTTLVMTKTHCHSCTVSAKVECPRGFSKKTTGKGAQDCMYRVFSLSMNGCSHECYKEVVEPQCCPGYWGPDCIECPEEAEKPCSNNGVCSDTMGGNGTCSCKTGFVGTACEDCAENLYGATCGSTCRCVHGLCNAGTHGDGLCTCFSGYKGPYCDQELPACSALQCQQNSRCIEEAHTGALVCKCQPGYQSLGVQCISRNPCLLQVCHAHATCAHTGPGKHSCTCGEGYSGDGTVCVAIDPCQTNLGGCSADTARCLYDGPGKSHCECKDGFDHLTGGVNCSLNDICKPDSCHKNANCSTLEPGIVECTCHQGFIGNGKICYGNIMLRLVDLNTEPGGAWTGQLSSAITLFGTISWPLSNNGPFTVFVPTNKAFKDVSLKTLMANEMKAKYLCKLHMFAGEMAADSLKKGDMYYTLTGKAAEIIPEGQLKIRIHGSRKRGGILQSDIIASNGIIHIINKLMDSVAPTVDSESEENLMKILSDYGKFAQFKFLLQKINMASVLEEPGPYTIFAPTGAAFDAMKEGELDYISSNEGTTKLLELVRNHIVASTKLEVYYAASSPRIVTMANQVLSFNVTETGQILVNGMAVLEADVEAKNGRLYSLDGVLTPPSIEPILPHRCDVSEQSAYMSTCVSCLKVSRSTCPVGVSTNTINRGCVFRDTTVGLGFPMLGCQRRCNKNITTPACCKGFYGPECSPCPGGFKSPCSRHGQCAEGVEGNGTCVCEASFKGSRCQYCSNPNKYGPSCEKNCDCIHGQCDNSLDSDGSCKLSSCKQSYTGKYCERHTQACGPLVQFCHAHAECDFNGGAVKCVCKPGFQGDGITCVEDDPCALPLRGGCSVNAKCIKTGPSQHTCQCLAGWREAGDGCEAINDCLGPDRGGCHPNATCIYIGPGQSDCMCKGGFRGNGRECEAINRCVAQNGGCHYQASCRYLSGEWKCVCADGYTGDGEVCYGNMGQELMGLPDVFDFIKWVTDADLLDTLSTSQNLTLLVPLSTAINKMAAEEKDFWTNPGNMPSLVRNHMIQGVYSLSDLRSASSSPRLTSLLTTSLPVSSTNQSTVIGGATITTANVMATNGLIHIIDTVLVPERRLSDGLLELLELRPEFSLFRSYLIQHNLTEELEKSTAYTVFAPTDSAVNMYLKKTAADSMDMNTTQYHIVLSERLLLADLQGGAYKETMLGFSYQLGIFPRDGKLFVNEAQVNISDIQSSKGVIHGLSSVLEINRNRCDKEDNKMFMGVCQDCFFPQDKPCPAGAESTRSLKKKCMFSRVYQGERLLSIGCKAPCKRTTIVRRCCDGFFGEQCEPCPGPKGQPCFGNGLCVDGINGTGVCQCNAGYNGTACETCQSGKYGIHCDQVCGCKHGRCNDGLKGDGTCECDVGWRGVPCNEEILSKGDELCNTVKCHSSANCVTEGSGSRCLCAAGFEGNGTYCKASDACEVDNGGCSPNAVCKRTLPGLRNCVCNPGYNGDGLVCVEINACLTGNGGCHDNADCIHTGPNKTSCACSQGYTGNGVHCSMIDLCRKKHECHRYARCNMTGPGQKNCTCWSNYRGDGITCKGTVGKELLTRKLRDFYMSLMMADISLQGRGPFTVFAPKAEAFSKLGTMSNLKKSREMFMDVMLHHVVGCHTLLASDLARPRNLTTLKGDVLSITCSEGTILINNKARVTYTDDPSTNGIIHEIDTFLIPENMKNVVDEPRVPAQLPVRVPIQVKLTDVVDQNGYKTFYKLLEDTGVLDLVNDSLHQPVTLFLPSDHAMAALPQEQKDFLYDEHNRPQLLEYLKYHILRDTKVSAAELPHLAPARTLQGSELTFNCGGTDRIGEIFINDGNCRIIQRHLRFKGGMAYGIDCLLDPPSLGGRCDTKETLDFPMPCGWCSTSTSRCPDGSKIKEVKPCDLPKIFVSKNTGCQTTCTLVLRHPKCCDGYYGRNCLVCPGGAGSRCGNHGKCDDGHLGTGNCTCAAGFQGVTCEMCQDGHYGPQCKACNCTEHGSCQAGLKGTGSCFCEQGWTGQRCETQQAEGPVCSPPCSPSGVCKDNNTCVCKPFYEGDGMTCTVADLCKTWNGGCAKGTKCSQKGEIVSCSACPKFHTGDGFSCLPMDPCASEDNGGCHEHATCTMTDPGKRKCACKDNYIGDGVTCEVKDLPINRCLQENGLCHSDAQCTDLHYEDSTVGVFHFRSEKGQYKLNYAQAQAACTGEGGTIATYTQLSYAQQAGLNMCAAGWLDEARVGYPTTYSNPNCGMGHVGIVDYGTRANLSETWDAFCHRIKEVKCECKLGYIGDGYSCTGNLLQVLSARPTFSNFLSQILNYSQVAESGKQFMKRLSNLTIQSTLFVPDNTGLYENQTLTQRDIEYHFSEGHALALKDLTNGSRIRTRLGHSLTVLGIADFLNPKALSSSRYINDRFVIDSDILASNGIIHVLQGPLKAPPPRPAAHAGHQAGMGVGVLLLIVITAAAGFVGYHFYTHKTNPFQFHYFKDEGEESTPSDINPSISNPMYDSAPGPSEPASSELPEEDKHQVVASGSYDLLQDS